MTLGEIKAMQELAEEVRQWRQELQEERLMRPYTHVCYRRHSSYYLTDDKEHIVLTRSELKEVIHALKLLGIDTKDVVFYI